MTFRSLLLAAACAACAAGQPPAPADRTAWYREAKFGMFIHWGPYSQASVEASWPIMRPDPKRWGAIAEPAYVALARTFNPAAFDPAAWVRLAKAAGQRYVVFTSKHHDGFAMFDSAYTAYKITKTPYGKDTAAMLAEACRAQGMPLGFYYSPPDMHHPGFRDTSRPAAENMQGEPWRPEWPLYLDYMELQLRELLTRYGDIAILWFDGLGQQAKYDGHRMHRVIRDLQPRTLINNRIGLPGDYDTPEQYVPKARPGRLFEVCMTINKTWGYNANDRDFKSATHLIRTLIDVASKGGNFLLNVGPTPQGTIQPEFVERLETIGRWLAVNGDAIYGTAAGPLQDLPYGRTTAKAKRIFVHIFDWPGPEIRIPGLPRAARVTLLAAKQPLRFRAEAGALVVTTPAEAPDPHATVLAIDLR